MALNNPQIEQGERGHITAVDHVKDHRTLPPEDEQLRALAAELAAALGQLRLDELDGNNRSRAERALSASKRLTRLVGGGPEDSTEDAAEPALPDLVGYRILMALEGTERQAEFGRALTRMGARYELVPDIGSGHALAQSGDFDLAIVDDELAGGSGRDLITALRTGSGSDDRFPVLGLCAADSEVAQHALRQAGADLVLASAGTTRLAEALAALVEQSRDATHSADLLLLDHDRFARLLDVAGSDGAPELLERLYEDLRQVEYGLGRALAELNPAETRTQTHVLVALAGAVGADPLQRLTEALNAAAHRDARDEMTALGCRVMRQLTHLVQFIAAKREADGPR